MDLMAPLLGGKWAYLGIVGRHAQGCAHEPGRLLGADCFMSWLHRPTTTPLISALTYEACGGPNPSNSQQAQGLRHVESGLVLWSSNPLSAFGFAVVQFGPVLRSCGVYNTL